jgi:hypothetical protein
VFLAVFVPGAIVVSAVLAFAPDAGPLLGAVAAVAFVTMEAVRARRHPWWSVSSALRHRAYTAVACLVAGVVLHATSRTGEPLCDPDLPVQGHAGWHILSAAGLALLASVVLERDTEPVTEAAPPPPSR